MHGGDRITKVTQEPQQRLNGRRSQWGGGCDEGTAVAPSRGDRANARNTFFQ